LIVRNNAGSALLSQRSREAFSGMCHTATDSAAGFQREAAPFWLRRFQRQKLKRARNAVRGNNASQPVSIAKPSMMLSYDSLETGTGSSNSLRSTIQSLSFRTSRIIDRNPPVCARFAIGSGPGERLRRALNGGMRQNLSACILLGPWKFARTSPSLRVTEMQWRSRKHKLGRRCEV
jgi:hypothetical protein